VQRGDVYQLQNYAVEAISSPSFLRKNAHVLCRLYRARVRYILQISPSHRMHRVRQYPSAQILSANFLLILYRTSLCDEIFPLLLCRRIGPALRATNIQASNDTERKKQRWEKCATPWYNMTDLALHNRINIRAHVARIIRMVENRNRSGYCCIIEKPSAVCADICNLLARFARSRNR